MNITIENETFAVIDTKEKITVADSFVVPQNKIGDGHGEAKIYLGHDNQDTRGIFGEKGFGITCFLLKKDLLNYLEKTKVEYLNPEQPYQNKDKLQDLWLSRKQKVEGLNEKIHFELGEKEYLKGPRVYAQSSDTAYQLIRELSLPNITYISIVKLANDKGEFQYYFKLFADYFGETKHPHTLEQEKEDNPDEDITRAMQYKFRRDLLDDCPFCPITLISDDRVLIASHIKPWAASNNVEKLDPFNGFMLTPNFDWLFDKGYLSFTDDKRTILSPFLSKMTYSKLNISDNLIIKKLPIEGREEYLKYHRENILN